MLRHPLQASNCKSIKQRTQILRQSMACLIQEISWLRSKHQGRSRYQFFLLAFKKWLGQCWIFCRLLLAANVWKKGATEKRIGFCLFAGASHDESHLNTQESGSTELSNFVQSLLAYAALSWLLMLLHPPNALKHNEGKCGNQMEMPSTNFCCTSLPFPLAQ